MVGKEGGRTSQVEMFCIHVNTLLVALYVLQNVTARGNWVKGTWYLLFLKTAHKSKITLKL